MYMTERRKDEREGSPTVVLTGAGVLCKHLEVSTCTVHVHVGARILLDAQMMPISDMHVILLCKDLILVLNDFCTDDPLPY